MQAEALPYARNRFSAAGVMDDTGLYALCAQRSASDRRDGGSSFTARHSHHWPFGQHPPGRDPNPGNDPDLHP
ncbi:hypothetical protein D3C71_2147460 [compost metagenome]